MKKEIIDLELSGGGVQALASYEPWALKLKITPDTTTDIPTTGGAADEIRDSIDGKRYYAYLDYYLSMDVSDEYSKKRMLPEYEEAIKIRAFSDILKKAGFTDVTDEIEGHRFIQDENFYYRTQVNEYVKSNAQSGNAKVIAPLMMYQYLKYLQCGGYIICLSYVAWDYYAIGTGYYEGRKEFASGSSVEKQYGYYIITENNPKKWALASTPKDYVYPKPEKFNIKKGMWITDIKGNVLLSSEDIDPYFPYLLHTTRNPHDDRFNKYRYTCRCVRTLLTIAIIPRKNETFDINEGKCVIVAKASAIDEHYLLVVSPRTQTVKYGFNNGSTHYSYDYVPSAFLCDHEGIVKGFPYKQLGISRDPTQFLRDDELFDISSGIYAIISGRWQVDGTDKDLIYTYPRQGFEYYFKQFGIAMPLNIVKADDPYSPVIFEELYINRINLRSSDWGDFERGDRGFTIDHGKFFHLCGTLQGNANTYSGSDNDRVGGMSITKRNLLLKTEDVTRPELPEKEEFIWAVVLSDEDTEKLYYAYLWNLLTTDIIPIDWKQIKIVCLFGSTNRRLNVFTVVDNHTIEQGDRISLVGWLNNTKYMAVFRVTNKVELIKAESLSLIYGDDQIVEFPLKNFISIGGGTPAVVINNPYNSSDCYVTTGDILEFTFYSVAYPNNKKTVTRRGDMNVKLPDLETSTISPLDLKPNIINTSFTNIYIARMTLLATQAAGEYSINKMEFDISEAYNRSAGDLYVEVAVTKKRDAKIENVVEVDLTNDLQYDIYYRTFKYEVSP